MPDVKVTYGGATIAEMSATGKKRLMTKGKGCKNDIIIDYTKPGGGGAWDWKGQNATLVSSFADFEIALKDTGFDTWTPSETATQILASTTFGTISADVANYDYLVKWTFDTDLKYLAGATMKSMPIHQKAIAFCQTFRRPRYYADLTARNYNYTQMSGNTTLTPFFLYYSSTGGKAIAITQTYGFYMTPQTVSLSSNTASPATLTIPRPILSARCHSSYMSTARAAEIDKTNSKLKLKCEVYRVDKNYTAQAIMKEIIESIND